MGEPRKCCACEKELHDYAYFAYFSPETGVEFAVCPLCMLHPEKLPSGGFRQVPARIQSGDFERIDPGNYIRRQKQEYHSAKVAREVVGAVRELALGTTEADDPEDVVVLDGAIPPPLTVDSLGTAHDACAAAMEQHLGIGKEADPTGRKPGEPGAKLDAGKVRMGLVLGGFANALMEVSKIGTKGAAKYSDNGWMSVPNADARYTDALLRHTFKHLAGEKIDPEWQLLHLAHGAWNALAVLELELRKAKNGISIPSTQGTVAGAPPVTN